MTRVAFLAGTLLLILVATATPAPDEAKSAAPDIHYFTDLRADLEIPPALLDRVLAPAGLADRAFGYTAEEMSNYGEARYLLDAVERLFGDVREVPRFSGRVGDGFLARASFPGMAAEYAYRLLGVRAGRGAGSPDGNDWGVSWIDTGTDADGALDAVLARNGASPPAGWQALPMPVKRLILRFLIAAMEAAPVLAQAYDLEIYRRAGFAEPERTPGVVLREFVALPFGDDEEVPPREAFEALDGLDLEYLAYASIVFLKRADGAIAEWLTSKCDPAGLTGFRFETAIGSVAVLGSGDDRYQTAADFVFDLGGSDTYVAVGASPRDLEHPVSVVVDLGGDDVWEAVEGPGIGSHGIGALFDLGGDDRYKVSDNGLGGAWFGTGVLVDYAGNDRYEGGAFTQGAAHAGVGLLMDLAGDDEYVCAHESQGFGGTLGIGALIDVTGDDSYLARLDGNISKPFRGKSVSFAQGTGFGRRADFGDGHSLAGGIGVLVDGAGDDAYEGGVYCQGAGYWWALGMLEDRAGNDTYSSVQYSLGSAPHMAIGCCVDLKGDDRYNQTTADLYMQSQGCARDGSIGVFIDGAGNDRYRNGNRSAGSGEINAIGLFWDRHGDDRYLTERGTPSPSTRSYGGAGHHNLDARSFRSVLPTAGVFLDSGGQDLWEERRPEGFAGLALECADGESWVHSDRERQRGAGLDVNWYSPVPEPVVREDDFTVHRFETTCNTYLLTSTKTGRFAVVDPGAGIQPVVRAWQELGHDLDAYWITHEHYDHVSGLGLITEDTRAPIRGHPNIQAGIFELQKNWEKWGFTEIAAKPPVLATHLVIDGDEVKLGNLTFTALFLPGHSRGSIGYLLGDRLLFSGDVLFQGSIGRTDFPGCDPERFARSLSEKLWDLPEGLVVLPGHMAKTTIAEEKAGNWLFEDQVRAARDLPPIPRPYVGIGIDTERGEPGVMLNAVGPDSPAEAAGLLPGDILTEFAGTKLTDPRSLIKAIRACRIGDRVQLVVSRRTERLLLTLTIGTRPQ
jgi:glyoxylase-like metal-dependent hydrolase (beta-lactamase superfamily II)